MLEDRDYMRQPAFEPRVTFTVTLLIVTAAVFLVQWISSRWPNSQDISDAYFALSLNGLLHGYVWQLFTFQFMHESWMHLLFNSLTIFFFGRSVETALGGRRFLTLYFSSGIIGGLAQMLYAWATGDYDGPVLGASAGALGLVGAFALLAWDEQFTMILYFVPVTLRGKTLFWVSAGVCLVMMMTPGSHIVCLVMMMTPGSHIANAAHLGGLLTGFFYVRQIVQGRWHFPQWSLPSRSPAPRELAAKYAGHKSFWKPTRGVPPAEDLTPDEFLQKEVDPILDKISARGIQSLTAREREILEKARSKMNKR